jgi:hypothetical protein
MRINLRLIVILGLFVATMASLRAQCFYKIILEDSYGDGWNNGKLTITNGATVSIFLLDNINDDGNYSEKTFLVNAGQPLVLSWTSGFFDQEVKFGLYDSDGDLVFSVVKPSAGVIYSGIAGCPTCPKPSNLEQVNIYDTRAKLKWEDTDTVSAVGYRVVYGPRGFIPGPGIGDTAFTVLPKLTLQGLQKKTAYDWYVQQDCGSGEFSLLAGPNTFETYWTTDVGIVGVETPVSSCALGMETVRILMKNFGAAPQSLVPFRYTVNGEDAGVQQPQDGFYTGVLGKDSIELIAFETMYDFSEPGEYVITVYTQMGGDEDFANDTFRYYVLNRLVAPYEQDFEVWSGGWAVDTSASVFPSWELGLPSKTKMDTAGSGIHAWVTSLDSLYSLKEVSYLVSPCFDFSEETDDPVIEFLIQREMEMTYDAAFLERSFDGGTSWEKVGLAGEGVGWYNTDNFYYNLGDVWSGYGSGWETARHRLDGAAGQQAVNLRFGFYGAPFALVGSEGVGIDHIQIYVPAKRDLSALRVGTLGENTACGLQQDKVSFEFTNFGSQPQGAFKVAYSVNGGSPVLETFNQGVVNPDELATYQFNTPFDSRDGLVIVRCWTQLNGDSNSQNDTVEYTIDHRPVPVPLYQNFEAVGASGLLPEGWTGMGGFVTNGHGNFTYVFGANLYNGLKTFQLDLPRHGKLGVGDSLSFTYRITEFSSGGTIGTVLGPGSNVEVQVSDNCGATYTTLYTINSLNHVTTAAMKKVFVNLSAYNGKSVLIRFLGNWAEGDYYVDLDNINILSCASDMGLTAQVTPSTNGTNGSIVVNVGFANPPYKYKWNNGAITKVLTNLGSGTYTVTVTDALGCTGSLTVLVGTTATDDIQDLTGVFLYPNPTAASFVVVGRAEGIFPVQFQLTDMVGHLLEERNVPAVSELQETFDLSPYPPGVYVLRLRGGSSSVLRRIVRH